MKKILIVIAVLAAAFMATCAQEQLPSLKYSKEPAVLQGCIINDISESSQKTEYIKVVFSKKYHSGTGDARIVEKAVLDDNGCCSLSLSTGTTVNCKVVVSEDYDFNVLRISTTQS